MSDSLTVFGTRYRLHNRSLDNPTLADVLGLVHGASEKRISFEKSLLFNSNGITVVVRLNIDEIYVISGDAPLIEKVAKVASVAS